jgi:hypothetical protein
MCALALKNSRGTGAVRSACPTASHVGQQVRRQETPVRSAFVSGVSLVSVILKVRADIGGGGAEKFMRTGSLPSWRFAGTGETRAHNDSDCGETCGAGIGEPSETPRAHA